MIIIISIVVDSLEVVEKTHRWLVLKRSLLSGEVVLTLQQLMQRSTDSDKPFVLRGMGDRWKEDQWLAPPSLSLPIPNREH